MHRFFLLKEELDRLEIKSEEFNHLKNVLRMKEGDDFVAICNDEFNYFCKITSLTKNSAKFCVTKKELNTANPAKEIAIFQGLAKGDKLELVTQKATEIGASKIVPVFFANCDVKANTNKLTRLEKIAVSACKQCGRSKVPEITECKQLKDLPDLIAGYDVCFFANEREDDKSFISLLNGNKNANKIAIIVGPEGGFTANEIATISSIAQSVSLGKRILRTETAGIFMLSVISAYYGA